MKIREACPSFEEFKDLRIPEDIEKFFLCEYLRLKNNGNKKILYIHTPLCDGKCKYCICPSVSIKNQSEVDEYAKETLPSQLIHYNNIISNIKFDEVYFGGGTPSLISASDWEQIFLLIPNFDNIPIKSIECSPDSITFEHVQLFKKYNFSYISLGVQSLDPDICRWQNRKYIRPEEIKYISQQLREYGLYFNLDLICYMSDGDIRDIPYFEKDLNYIMKECKPSSICIHQLHQAQFTCEKTMRLMEVIKRKLALYPEYECINAELNDEDVFDDTVYRAEYRLVCENRKFKHYMWNKYPILPIAGYDILAVGNAHKANIKSNVNNLLYLPVKNQIRRFDLKYEFEESERQIREKKGLL